MQLAPYNQGDLVQEAINRIYVEYGDKVRIKDKGKALNKFGVRSDVGTSNTTVAQLGGTELHETYIATNGISHVSSSSTNDSEEIVVEGQTIDGNGDFTFVTQTATLNGQTKVALSTPLARCTRMYNNNGTNLEGTIYSFQDDTLSAGVPQTDTKIHCIIPQGKNQSFKCATTISKDDYWILTGGTIGVGKKQTAAADFFLEIRLKGKVFRQRDVLTASTNGSSTVPTPIVPYLIVPPNSDVRVTCAASVAGTEVVASLTGYLALKQ